MCAGLYNIIILINDLEKGMKVTGIKKTKCMCKEVPRFVLLQDAVEANNITDPKKGIRQIYRR